MVAYCRILTAYNRYNLIFIKGCAIQLVERVSCCSKFYSSINYHNEYSAKHFNHAENRLLSVSFFNQFFSQGKVTG